MVDLSNGKQYTTHHIPGKVDNSTNNRTLSLKAKLDIFQPFRQYFVRRRLDFSFYRYIAFLAHTGNINTCVPFRV